MSDNTKKINGFQIAATYIGITIGAGFASGQEVLQYFSFFGLDSFPALTLAAMLFIVFGWMILNLGARLQARSHREILDYTNGKYLGLAVDLVITFFLFGAFVAMLAGAGASLQQQFAFPPLVGALIMSASSLATVFFGLAGIVSALSFLVPVMMAGIFGVSLSVLLSSPTGLNHINIYTQPWAAVIPYWPLSALIYVSYNLVMAVAILAPMGSMSENRKQRWEGALLGGLGLGAGILAINLALLIIPDSFSYPIPMSFIAAGFSPAVSLGYTAVLLAAIYTTAVGGLYGFAARLTRPGTRRFKLLVLVITAAAIAASQLGFTTLVRFLYAGVGIAGFLLLGGLAYSFIKTKSRPKPNPAV
ncbi:MAG: membrane protein [Peptococcaceae bacterium BRH_c4b]|nr:MAG: membrane protein [Peptococcaceae bacterium BRH_c4b]